MRTPRIPDSSDLFEAGVFVVPERLKRARELRSMTQAMLATEAALDQSYIALIEKGERNPSEHALTVIARVLGLPATYFFQAIRMRIDGQSVRFRASKRLGKKVTATLVSETEHYLEILALLLQQVNAVSVKLKPKYESPKLAARRIRAILGFEPTKPFPHLIRHFESLGGLVVALGHYEKFDAFADWVGNQREWPMVAVSTGTDPARLRMNIAHEIGHLVLHKDRPIDPLAEHEAFEFASELILPEVIVRKVFAAHLPSLDELSRIRCRWGISEAAIVYSAHRIGLMTERQYGTYNIRLRSQRSPSEREPVERPRALRKMAEVAFGVPLPYDEMEKTLHISACELEEFFGRYVGERAEGQEQPARATVVKIRSRVN